MNKQRKEKMINSIVGTFYILAGLCGVGILCFTRLTARLWAPHVDLTLMCMLIYRLTLNDRVIGVMEVALFSIAECIICYQLGLPWIYNIYVWNIYYAILLVIPDMSTGYGSYMIYMIILGMMTFAFGPLAAIGNSIVLPGGFFNNFGTLWTHGIWDDGLRLFCTFVITPLAMVSVRIIRAIESE